MSLGPGYTGCGHGHVFPVAGGVLCRCGGPALCRECARDMAALERMPAEEAAAVARVRDELKERLSRPGKLRSA